MPTKHDILYTTELDYTEMLQAAEYWNTLAHKAEQVSNTNVSWQYAQRAYEFLIQCQMPFNDREN